MEVISSTESHVKLLKTIFDFDAMGDGKMILCVTLLMCILKPVLMGLFLFLGISSLPGNEMWERIKGLFKDSKRASQEPTVPRRTTTLFTSIQVACLVGMVYVKG